jgi:hypothetical protein
VLTLGGLVKYSELSPLPWDTVRAARSVFNATNTYLSVGDQINSLLLVIPAEHFIHPAFPQSGSPALAALITAFQYHERLDDYQAADAVRFRIDWQYALHLPTQNSGIDPDRLCSFRIYVYRHPEARQALQQVFDRLEQIGFFKNCSGVEAESACVFICSLNRARRIVESFQYALEALSGKAPDMLRYLARPGWYSRYFSPSPGASYVPDFVEPQETALAIGRDIRYLLQKIEEFGMDELAQLPEIAILGEVLDNHFEATGPVSFGQPSIRWRQIKCVLFINETESLSSFKPVCHNISALLPG